MGQVIVIILTLSDVAETESRKGVVELRVLTCWKQLAIVQFLPALKPV